MIELLEYSLERISSLQNFYESQFEEIKEKSDSGKSVNGFGFFLDTYLEMRANRDKVLDCTNEKFFNELSDFYESEVEILEFEEDSSGTTNVVFKYKDADSLLEKGYELDLKKASSSFRKYADMPIIHGSNTLIMLITRFEEFISLLLSEIFEMFPPRYLDDKKISYSDICGKGIDEVRELIIAQEVDGKMRESFTEWFKIFESHGMKFASCKEEIDNLHEICARRNIFVHNCGEVNSSYLKAVPASPYKIGDTLPVNKEYLQAAFSSITIIIYTIMIETCRLIDDKDKYLHKIFLLAFEELKAENYQLCKIVFEQLTNNKNLSEQLRLMSKVNYWIAENELDNNSLVKAEIEAFDVSALNSQFALAKELLLENYSTATELLREIFERKELNATAVKEWPMFKHYRETDFYAKFTEAFPLEFNISTLEVKTVGDESTDVCDDLNNSDIDKLREDLLTTC